MGAAVCPRLAHLQTGIGGRNPEQSSVSQAEKEMAVTWLRTICSEPVLEGQWRSG